MFGTTSVEKAYLGPFVVFLLFLALSDVIASLGDGLAAWAIASPKYWIFPLQTVVCGWLLWKGWPYYSMKAPRNLAFTTAIGATVLLVWISPQLLGIAAPRMEGFDPHFFGDGGSYSANVAMRFVRLVIVVPLVEEIFWRGFLLRYLIKSDFTSVPFGTFELRSFLIVTFAFCLVHQFADWPAAAVAGALYNWVACRTKSLSACVLAHAITNLGLGLYVMRTGQWGFW
jgi:CAAX prenyl protease-like protein